MLGGNWSNRVTVKENHKLVHTGPYRIVRHPIYSGFCWGCSVRRSSEAGYVVLPAF